MSQHHSVQNSMSKPDVTTVLSPGQTKRKSSQVDASSLLRRLAIGWPNATQVERKSFAKVAEFLFFFLFPRLRLGRAATFTVAAAYTCIATGSPVMVFLFLMFF